MAKGKKSRRLKGWQINAWEMLMPQFKYFEHPLVIKEEINRPLKFKYEIQWIDGVEPYWTDPEDLVDETIYEEIDNMQRPKVEQYRQRIKEFNDQVEKFAEEHDVDEADIYEFLTERVSEYKKPVDISVSPSMGTD